MSLRGTQIAMILAVGLGGLGVSMTPEIRGPRRDPRPQSLTGHLPQPRREPQPQNTWRLPSINFVHSEQPVSKRRKRRLRGKKES